MEKEDNSIKEVITVSESNNKVEKELIDNSIPENESDETFNILISKLKDKDIKYQIFEVTHY